MIGVSVALDRFHVSRGYMLVAVAARRDGMGGKVTSWGIKNCMWRSGGVAEAGVV